MKNKPTKLTAKQITFFRESYGISRPDLAEIMGVTTSHLSLLESGLRKPSPLFERSFCLLMTLLPRADHNITLLTFTLPDISTIPLLDDDPESTIKRMMLAFEVVTRTDLARELEVSPSTVTCWSDSGVPTKYLQITRKMTGCSFSWLMGLSDNPIQMPNMITNEK